MCKRATTSQELVRVFQNDPGALNLLYESGTFRKPVDAANIGDKDSILKELRDGILFSSWVVISQIQEGLKNLGVLEIIRENRELLQQFFCYEAPALCSGILS